MLRCRGTRRWPKATSIDLLLAMTQETTDKYAGDVKPGGQIIVANLVTLGVIYKLAGIISEEAIINSIRARVPKGTEDMNIRTFKLGQERVV